MDFRALNDEYLSIYSKNTSAESLTEDYTYNTQYGDTLDEEYEMIVEDILLEEDSIEEVVFDMLDEGFEPEEIEEIFEEILDEARVDMAARAAARKQYMASSEKSAKQARSRAAAKERSDKRAAQVAAVKGKVKSAIGKAQKASSDAKSSVRAKVKDTKQQSHVGLAKYASKRNLMRGAGLKTQSSKGRGELRKAVAKDIKGRAVAKASRGAVKAYSAGRSAAQAAGDAAGRAKQSLKNKYARAKRSAGAAADSARSGARGAVGRFARKVSDKAGKFASRLGEEFDTFDAFDVVLEFLQVEGYAETLEEAEWMMANIIDEEAIDIIHEIDENRRMARDPEGRKSGHSKQPDPSKPGFTGMGNMSIDQIRKMSARIEKEKTKKEEAEYVDENRRAARAAGGSKDDSKKQPDPSKPGFTGIGNMSIDQIRKMSARIEKDKKEEFEAWFDEVLEAYKEPNLGKMRDQEDRHRKAAVRQRGGSRGSSKNRSMKMSSIRGALERGEDPRADGYGGKRAERGNPPEDHRAAFSKNPLNNPPRRVKKPGV